MASRLILLGALLCSILCARGVICYQSDLEIALEKEFESFFESSLIGEILQEAIEDLDLTNLLIRDKNKERWPEEKVEVFCSVCAAGINEMLRAENSTVVINKSIELCLNLGFGTEYVCDRLVNVNAEQILYIVANSPDETGKDICGVVFESRGCESDNPNRIWNITLPDVPKPPVETIPFPEPGIPTMKVLHLADTHYDPDYLPGGSTVCEEIYLCCRYVTDFQNESTTAGFWGSYDNCDLPKWTLEAMYAHIAQTHPDIDFIIWTGDIIPHDVWDTSRATNLATIHEMSDLIVKYFPGIPVYPAVGNHESDPCNQFPQPYVTDPEFEISWLYNELNAIWQTWLPESTVDSVLYSAYYSVLVKPGLRLISLNTMFCYGYNWWLIHDSKDVANELELLAQELQKAEDAGEKAYIIGHIPSGSGDCSRTWSHQFNRVVSRYENTITSIFYGHTHDDHFMLYFDPEDPSRVYDIAYIAQSQTTYTNANPGYKIYTIEGEYTGSNFRVLDHENYILDLPVANFENRTDFTKLYSAKEEYGLVDLSPQSWLDLVVRMREENSTLFDSFYRNYVKASAPKLENGCDDDCKSSLLCSLVTSDTSDKSRCPEENI